MHDVFVIYYSGHSDENGLLLGGDRVTYRELRQWLDTTMRTCGLQFSIPARRDRSFVSAEANIDDPS
jgi:hypothetical protein